MWRHEVRRTGRAALLAPPLVAGLVVAVTLANGTAGAESEAMRNLFNSVEMAMPLVAGIGAASLIGRDPAAELHLTLPTPYRATLVRRLAIAVGWTALVAVLIVAVLVVTGWWARWPEAHGAFVGQLVWLAPTLWLAAAGFLAGAVFRGPAPASGLVAVLWILQQLFAGGWQEHQWSRLLYLFATTRGTVPGDWLANRLTLVATGVALGYAGWLLVGRAERLIGEEAE
ncbi:hypothetical protein Prum_097740 [Phytohabitans rumicis]|uniref:Uncharacterized protein n=1 Tax=Phytohabitans rumicis TaxID=1076125 RepID=A0A6V8LFT8_9ACTN|nr:hypothetical protein Prum_097740 [Phytohabitans rumicis]